LSGNNGQRVRVQRSPDLVHWDDWQTVVSKQTGSELTDDTSAGQQMFYRAVEDNSNP